MTTSYLQNADPTLINALASGMSVPEAAAEAGISRRTAFRRLKDPEIQRQIDDLRETLTDVALDRLCHSAEPACQRLNDLLLKSESENVQLSAARTIIDRMFTIRSIHKLQDRIRELEAQLAQQPPKLGTSYWPASLEEGPPCADGLEPQDGYRLIAIWLSYQIYKGGLPEEQVQDLKQQIAEMRKNARHYDDVMDSPD